jgi:hypothetical protein
MPPSTTISLPTMKADSGEARCSTVDATSSERPKRPSGTCAGELVERRVADPREPNTLYVAWRGDGEGRALAWWLEQLRQPRLAKRLIRGVDLAA